MDKNFGIVIICTAILFLCFVGPASATTWSVDDSGEANFTRIQEAINNASDGDTIIVHSGVYYENVYVNKSVTLMGIGQPVVDAGGAGDAITLTADGITLVGFTATGSSWFDAGIKVISNNNTITGNNASNNNWHGISLSHSSNNDITGNNASNNNPGGISLSSSSNNTITGNNVRSNGVGISLYDSNNNNTITGNNVSNNSGSGIGLYYSSNNNTITGNVFVNDGLCVVESHQNIVEDNTVNGKPLVYLEDASDYKVTDAGQVILVNCSNITVESLDISNTSVGIALWETKDCILSNNKVSNNSRNGISLYDSSNNTITGNTLCNNKYGGIYLHLSSSDNTITGNNVSSNWNGIGLYYSCNNNIITGNNVSNNRQHGIDLYDSSNNAITGNTVCNNKYGGIYLHYSSSDNTITGNTFVNDGLLVGPYQNIVEDNTVNGKPLVYLEDASDYTVRDAGQVILANCSNITVENQDISNTSVGIELWDTEDCILSNNKVSNNSRDGIFLFDSSNNTITGNTLCYNDYDGICSHYSSNNAITGNNVCNNSDGIDLRFYSNNNTITENNVSNNNRKGIYLSDSNNNTIIHNNVYNNDFGIYSSADDNLIYLNNFIDNTDNVYYFYTGTNIWNSTEKIIYCYNGTTYESYLGNYWHDYEEKYPDAEETDSTGIWDMPYILKKDKDNYPLMERFENYGMIRSPIVHPPAAEPIIAPGDNFTEFYILGPNGTASDYPTNLTVGEDGKVIIGIVNHEYTNVTYQLEVWLSEELIGGNSIVLMQNETWESPFTFRVTKTGRQKLEFLLFKGGLKEPYRNLHLWVDVK